jgi:hypothetical protein
MAFNIGVLLFVSFTFILGRYPNDYFYYYYSTIVPTMILIRFISYRKRKLHYYFTDFCYFGTGLVWVHVTFFPKNEIFHHIAYLYSNGVLGLATAAFSNALIFHKLDKLVCLVTHAVPLVCMWNVKHVTMSAEQALPEE